ncbi:hypothetical protein, partial [Polaromonas sp.]|uniref:hypothetical protein n=1 Tax=Polaromonas sp. TaxID=1869339 RepID=UPI00356377D3
GRLQSKKVFVQRCVFHGTVNQFGKLNCAGVKENSQWIRRRTQKVTFFGNTDNVNFGWFAYDSTDGHPKKCYPILNHALHCIAVPLLRVPLSVHWTTQC